MRTGLCEKCGRKKDMYYKLWCPLCEKPEIKLVPTLNFMQCLEHLEALGHTGIKDRVWNSYSDEITNESSFVMFLDYNEDTLLIKETWNIEGNKINMLVSY